MTQNVGPFRVTGFEFAVETLERIFAEVRMEHRDVFDEVKGRLEMEIPEGESGAYHTLAGFVMARLGHIPREGDAFEFNGLRFEVVDMDARRVDGLKFDRSAHAPISLLHLDGLAKGCHGIRAAVQQKKRRRMVAHIRDRGRGSD